jgi:hypothetical protein
MEIPADNELTYATSNLEDTMKVFDKFGVHLLSSEEIAQQMPTFGKLVETRRQPSRRGLSDDPNSSTSAC